MVERDKKKKKKKANSKASARSSKLFKGQRGRDFFSAERINETLEFGPES